MDPLYTEERASRERLWSNLVRLDEESRRKPPKRAEEHGIRKPLSIVHVERNGESAGSQPLELCYTYERRVKFVVFEEFFCLHVPVRITIIERCCARSVEKA